MPKHTAHPSRRQDRPSADRAFARDVAELKASFDRIEALLRPLLRRELRRATASVPAPVGMAAAATPPVAAEPATKPAADNGAPAAEPWPSGTDLSDPKHFGLLPPTAELERGDSAPEDYQRRLARHLTFATRVLHTSGVPAAVWREWRTFEKILQDRLRQLNTGPA